MDCGAVVKEKTKVVVTERTEEQRDGREEAGAGGGASGRLSCEAGGVGGMWGDADCFGGFVDAGVSVRAERGGRLEENIPTR